VNAPHPLPISGKMSRTFKSGNSIALRLPKDVGLAEGEEVTIISHDDGSFTFWKLDKARDVFLNLYGSMSPGFMAEGRGEIDQGERDWSPNAR
jgi:antitoxin VapB